MSELVVREVNASEPKAKTRSAVPLCAARGRRLLARVILGHWANCAALGFGEAGVLSGPCPGLRAGGSVGASADIPGESWYGYRQSIGTLDNTDTEYWLVD